MAVGALGQGVCKFISILLHNICSTGNFSMLYCCKDWKNIIRDYFNSIFYIRDFLRVFFFVLFFLLFELGKFCVLNYKEFLWSSRFPKIHETFFGASVA